MATQPTYFDNMCQSTSDKVLGYREIHVDIVRVMTIVRYSWGWLIETDSIDEDGVTTLECLSTVDGVTATLLNRTRHGDAYNEMKSYPRDSQFPVGCKVHLTRRVEHV
jgi:hypothetical protein